MGRNWQREMSEWLGKTYASLSQDSRDAIGAVHAKVIIERENEVRTLCATVALGIIARILSEGKSDQMEWPEREAIFKRIFNAGKEQKWMKGTMVRPKDWRYQERSFSIYAYDPENYDIEWTQYEPFEFKEAEDG